MLAIGDNKRCSRCKIWKSISDFYKNKRNRDGYGTECRECKSEQNTKTNVHRHCANCKEYKPVLEFKHSGSNNTNDLCRWWCKECYVEYNSLPEIKKRKIEERKHRRLTRQTRINAIVEQKKEQARIIQKKVQKEQVGISKTQEAALRRHARVQWAFKKLAELGIEI